ncbi:hypothetical protein BH18ACI4_BH18ACI4_14260 [soil metagenome]
MPDADEVRDADKLTGIVLVDHFIRCWVGLAKLSNSGKSDARGRTGTIHARINTVRMKLRIRTREVPRRNFEDKNCQDVTD